MKSYRKLVALFLVAACLVGPPPNRGPVLSGKIPAQRLTGPEETVALAVGAYFTDPDGDALTFTASSADHVSAAMVGDTLHLYGPEYGRRVRTLTVGGAQGASVGGAVVTVTASDPAGLSVWATVAVVVNQAPRQLRKTPSHTLTYGAPPEEMDVSMYFTDPDGDVLTFAALSSDTEVVRVAVSGTTLTLETRAVGLAAVTVTASDPDGLEAQAVFPVEVAPGQPLSLALMRVDGNGLSLALPDSLRDPSAVNISATDVVTATVADGWLELVPRSIGRADVELVPFGGAPPGFAGVEVREAVGTFGIDIVMDRPAPPGYAETMIEAADWWSSVLDGTEWEDRRPGCYNNKATALADEVLIHAGIFSAAGGVAAQVTSCFWSGGDGPLNPGGGYIRANMSTPGPGDVDVMRHEIGHVLGLVGETGLRNKTGEYFIGSRAVETYRAGGGDPSLPGVPMDGGAHWYREGVGCELMNPVLCRHRGAVPDALSLAALLDLGFTVDMMKATPWRKVNAAAVVAGKPFREHVDVRIVPRPVPE